MQYAAEIAYPTPEGTSNGLIQLFGQASVIFVFIMEALKSEEGSFTPSLLLAAGLLLVSAVIITQLHDPKVGESAARASDERSLNGPAGSKTPCGSAKTNVPRGAGSSLSTYRHSS
jgi:hypothetical protein